jgi:hypothetical protein
MYVFSECRTGNNPLVKNSLSSSQIIKSIDKGKPVIIVDMIITDDLDFTLIKEQSIISSAQRSARVRVPVTFIKCIFLGKIITNRNDTQGAIVTRFYDNLSFEACDFKGDSDFSNMSVSGTVNFSGATFRGKAEFNNCTFEGRQTWFISFIAEKLFSMQNAFIAGEADFLKGKALEKITFQSTCFTGTANFSSMECKGKTDFSLTVFNNNVLFPYARFGGEFRMSNVRCEGDCNLVSVEFTEDGWVTNSIFYGNVNFSNSKVSTSIDLSGTLFARGKPETEGMIFIGDKKLITKGARYIELLNYKND